MLKKLSILLLLVGLKHVTCIPGFMKILPGPYDEGGMKYEGIKDEGVPSTTFPPASPGLLSWMQCQPAFVAPTDGFVSCTNGNNIRSICTFTCDEGYEMLGSDSSKCDSYMDWKLRWSSDAPRCEKSTCEPVWDAPVDGSVRCTNGNNYGSVCRFTCDEGYIMLGRRYSRCYNSNTGVKWSNDAPRCEKSTCEPAWDAPVAGTIICSNGNSAGSYCRFDCDEGYQMVGSRYSRCHYSYIERKFIWTSDAPSCEKPTCEPPFDAPVDGSVNCTDGNDIGSVCRFDCDEGYELVGDDQSECVEYDFVRYWTNRAPVCRPRTCQPALVAPTDGSVSCTDGNNFGSICTFTCDERTIMVGEPQTECKINETGVNWTNDAPLCEPLLGFPRCGPFDAPTNGSVSCTHGDFVGSVCTFVCDEGFGMVGDSQSECIRAEHATGEWTSKNAPRCVYLESLSACEPAFVAPAHGSVNCTDDNNIGSYCTFTCDEGYELKGDDRSSCLQGVVTGVWTSSAPVCVARCQHSFVAPTDGSVSCTDGNNYGSVCTFTCDDETIMVGESQSECQISETGTDWTSDAPLCVPLEGNYTCEPAFDSLADGSVTCTDGNFIGSVCRFACDEGYEMVGDDQSECVVANFVVRYWKNLAPVCRPRTCQPALVAPIYGSVSCTDGNNYGSVCTFTCDEGTIMNGESQSECQIMESEIIWLSDAPFCEPLEGIPRCGPFDAPTNGSVSCTHGDFVGSVCTFVCDEGFGMVGDGQSECIPAQHAMGEWTSKNAPRCVYLESLSACEPAFVAPAHGSVNCTDDNNIGSYCTFTCDEGYELKGDDRSSCAQGVVTGVWTSSAPVCVARCQHSFVAPTDGSVSCTDGNNYGSVCTFTCDDETIMVGESQSECQISEIGTDWTNDAPLCVPLEGNYTCEPAFDSLADGSVTCTDGNFIGSVCKFACDEGYEMVGSDESECVIANFVVRYWTNLAPVCRPHSTDNRGQHPRE